MTSGPAYEEAFDFINGLDALPDTDAVVAGAAKIVARYGIDYFIITGLPETQFERAVLVSNWPVDFFSLYISNDFIRFDPLARRCRRSRQPFEWTATQYEHDPDSRTAEVMRRAADFGLERGFIVPISTPDGFEACVSMAGKHLELTAHSKALIHLVALYGYERVRKLAGGAPATKPRLTAREREVLQWATRGKSTWEIGEILGIGRRTVEEHVATAVRKLGATNRSHAIAVALRDKLIEL